jgi:polysaccharide pyruvyl transferase WcaK-like protein
LRVLIDPGSHHLLNLGDVSMLHMCVARLAEMHPDARVQVLTTDPRRLALHCPGVEPLDAAGRYRWTESATRPSRSRRLARARLALNGRRLARAEPAAGDFVEALLNADLLLMSGRGGLTDAFPEETDAVLTELEAAASIGLPIAMVGQGVGPLEDATLRARAREVLPGVALLAVREGRSAPALLEALGVPAERVVVTGDDAIEPAHERRAGAAQDGPVLGINVRVAGYSGLSQADAGKIVTLAQAAADRHGAGIQAVRISSHPDEDDGSTIAAALGNGLPAPERPTEPDTVSAPIDAAGRCRVVVAGSYHAALFALAQGIPAVGIARTPYYLDKLLGLREQFGNGCRVVALTEPASLDAISAQIDELWELAPTMRDDLLAAAERQIALSRATSERAMALGGGATPRRAVAAVGEPQR